MSRFQALLIRRGKRLLKTIWQLVATKEKTVPGVLLAQCQMNSLISFLKRKAKTSVYKWEMCCVCHLGLQGTKKFTRHNRRIINVSNAALMNRNEMRSGYEQTSRGWTQRLKPSHGWQEQTDTRVRNHCFWSLSFLNDTQICRHKIQIVPCYVSCKLHH